MGVPDDATLHTLQAEMAGIGFATGTEAQEDFAWELAWEAGESAIGTNFLTGVEVEERHIWPRGWLDYSVPFRYLQLNKTHVVSMLTATVVHDLGTCNCGTDNVSGCILLYSPRRAELEVRCTRGSIAAGCGCIGAGREAWVDVTYVAGAWNTPGDLPASVKMALAILAQEFKNLAATSGGAVGAAFVQQWSSMDYSERLGLLEKTPMGASSQANMAWRLLRKYKVRRMVGFRGRPSVTG